MAKKSTHTRSIYEHQADLCSALANPIRQQILEMLFSKEKTFTEILTVLDIPKANLSQHLAVLKDAGILHSRKEGQFQYFSLGIPRIKEACNLVRSILLDKISIEEKRNSELARKLRKSV